MSTNRLEAFSDGVIAVAITLLVLDIRVPPPDSTPHLGHALLVQWPRYAAYVTSFTTIGIIWINHHAMIGRLERANRLVLALNNLLLLSIGALPFATSLMASYLKKSSGEHLAAAVYGAAFLLMSLLFVALNRYTLISKPELLQGGLSLERRRAVLRRGVVGILPYLVATGLAAASPYATLAICFAVALYYALPVASGGET